MSVHIHASTDSSPGTGSSAEEGAETHATAPIIAQVKLL